MSATQPTYVRVTQDLLDRGKSPRGGWNRGQLAALGVAWPPPAGWQKLLCGRLVLAPDAERFLALRGNRPPRRREQAAGLF
jgi:hypothetical protein